MSVNAKINGKVESLNLAEKDDFQFFLTNQSGIEIQITTPLKLDSKYKDKDFEVYLLAKKDVKESDIYQVYRKKTDSRIGWAIPVISLDSDLHDYKDNQHFLRYAYIGIKEALKSIDLSTNSKLLSGENTNCVLSDIFHEETVLLILSKETYGDGFNFDIDRATPSLIKNGYVRLTGRNPNEIKHKLMIKIRKKIYLEEIASDLDEYVSIADLMNYSFAYEENSTFRFFYLYQIFELLIDQIYKNEQKFLIDKLVDAMGNSGRTKESLEKIQSFMSEKKRLGLLIDNYTEINGELINLRSLCNNFLSILGRDNSDNFEGYFYKIRNFIFHQYRDLPRHSTELLEDIVNEVVCLLPSILSNYKLPAKATL